MSDNKSETGCFTILWPLIILCFSYAIGLGMLGEPRKSWHYAAALPFGLFWWWICCGNGWEFIFKWLLIPGLGIGLMIWFWRKGFYVGMCVAGVTLLITGAFCASRANKHKSPPWAFNSLSAYAFGLALLVTGLILRFS